jgi:lipopolysaccharide export system permease protein
VKTLSRYVLREHFGPLAFSLTALTSLLLLNFIAKRFGDLVGKGLPWTVIIEFFLLAIPFTLAMTLPMAVLVSVLYAFSRLAAESEITALKASGVGMGRVLVPVLGAASVLAVGMVLFNDQLLPRANHRLRTLQTDIGKTKPTFALREQVINDVVPGRLSIRAARIDKATNRMYEVVIYDFGDAAKRRTIVADSGDLALVAATGNLRLVLYHGEMTELPPSDPGRMSRLRYVQDQIVVRGVANSFMRDTTDDYKSEREMGVCEMQAQVTTAERDRVREHALAVAQMTRATTALVRGRVDSLPAPAVPERGSLSIGRVYCDASAVVAGWFARAGDDADPPPPAAPAATLPLGDTAQRTVPVAAPSSGAEPAGAVASAPAPTTVAPISVSSATAGVGVVLDQARMREQSARAVEAQYAVEVHKKFSLAAACVVFVLLGAPIALRFPRGGVGLVIGASLVVFALYYVCLIGGESLADDLKVPPAIAMWAANTLFTIAGIVLFVRMGKEGVTARGGDLGELTEAIAERLRRLRRRPAADAAPRTA